MAHENTGLRLAGEGYLRRVNADTEQPVIGPLPLEYIGASPKTNRDVVLDPRRATRGAPLHVVVDPQEPSGKLIVLATPMKILAIQQGGVHRTYAQAAGTVAAEPHDFVADYGVQLDHQHVSGVAVYPGARATLATGTTGANNAITWTAVDLGTDGNAVTVAIVDPSGNGVALSVAVTGTDIVVTGATDGSSALTSTAADVIAAIRASAAASALVTVANTSTSTGAGVVAAVAETALSGGSVSGTAYAEGTDYEILDAYAGIVRPLSTGTMGASGSFFVAYFYGAIAGEEVTLGGDVVQEFELTMMATNDLADDAGQTGSRMRVHMPRLLLSGSGEVNLAGTAAVKAEFEAVPLIPAAGGSAMVIQRPTYA